MIPPQILVIDDDLLVLAVVQACLSRVGFDVVTCSSAFQAIEKLKEQSFELVLTDYNMPVANGSMVVDAVAQLRPEIPVTIMTGNVEAITPTCFRRGVTVQVLAKPFTFEVLTSHVRSAVEGSALKVAS